MASAVVTVARMIGMAVGLAVLTAYGSTTIDRLSEPRSTRRPTPTSSTSRTELRGRPLKDPLVVDALETLGLAARPRGSWSGSSWSPRAVTAVAIPPSLLLGGRPRMLADGTSGRSTIRPTEASDAAEEGPPVDGGDDAEPSLAL